MPVAAATVLFVAFILWLLRRSEKSAPDHSLGLWIPTLWIGIMLSKPVMYWFSLELGGDGDLETYLDGNPIDRNISIVLICSGLVVLLRRPVNWAAVFRQSFVIWLFFAYMLLSVSWSPYPFVSLKRLVKDLGSVVMILIILTDPHRWEALRRVLVRCSVVLVPLSVLLIKYYPEVGRYYHRWTDQVQYAGVTTNKNSLGVLAMVGGLFLLWHFAESKKESTLWRRFVSVGPEVLVFLQCMWILQITDSATSRACFVIGTVLFVAGRTALAGMSVKKTVGIIAVVGLGGWLALWSPDLRGLFATSLGRDATLTTRTDIWTEVLRLPTNPLVGAGFASVWLTPEGLTLSRALRIPHAHNGYLETYLNGGAIGVALLIGVLLMAAHHASRHLSLKTPPGAFYVAFVFTGIIYNFSEVTFNNGNAIGLLLWLIALSGTDLMILQPEGKPDSLVRGAKQWKRTYRVRAANAVASTTRPTWRNARVPVDVACRRYWSGSSTSVASTRRQRPRSD